ncbi:5499_t:CDS:1 [Gigaspora margarita]|uniref:5499_t:CDS:1 n=1 Tax=Gigaspora margarita TaxID=4874 RepID=A0ABN7WGS8_GIGMA|nr:5499_t:CDS:1 [Gigaspora margarita]
MEFLITSKFLKNVTQLRKQIKNSLVTEIRITNNSISCYNHEGEPVTFAFAQDITIKPMEEARISLYLSNLNRIDIPSQVLEEVYGKTWDDQIVYIRDKLRENRLDQISLLQFYYFLGERLEEKSWSPEAKEFIKIKFSTRTYRYVWKAAKHTYQLYYARGVHNLLLVQNITAGALTKLSKENFDALVNEAQFIRKIEMATILKSPMIL